MAIDTKKRSTTMAVGLILISLWILSILLNTFKNTGVILGIVGALVVLASQISFVWQRWMKL